MPSSAVQTPFSREQLLLVLHAHLGEWQQRYQLQRIGLDSFGEACGYGSTARNQATATTDVDVWVELNPLTPQRHRATETGAGGAAAAPGGSSAAARTHESCPAARHPAGGHQRVNRDRLLRHTPTSNFQA